MAPDGTPMDRWIAPHQTTMPPTCPPAIELDVTREGRKRGNQEIGKPHHHQDYLSEEGLGRAAGPPNPESRTAGRKDVLRGRVQT